MVLKISKSAMRVVASLTAHPEFRKHPFLLSVRFGRWGVRQILRRNPDGREGSWQRGVFGDSAFLEYELLWVRDRLLKRGGVALDVGAHLGKWTTVMAKAVGPTGRVIAVEPSATTARGLIRTVRNLGLEQVSVVQVALGESAGHGKIFHDPDTTMNSLAPSGGGFEEVRISTLDELVNDMGIDKIDVIKIDTEGNDENVVRGGELAIRRFNPVVIFEVNLRRTRELGLKPDGCWLVLESWGYSFYHMDRRSRLVEIETFDLNISGRNSWNIVALMSGEQ